MTVEEIAFKEFPDLDCPGENYQALRREGFVEGYKRANQDTIDAAVEWLINNARYYMSTARMCETLSNVLKAR